MAVTSTPPRYYLSPRVAAIAAAGDVAAARTGYTPVILGWALTVAGKFQSDATLDLSGLVNGNLLATSQVPFLIVGEDGKKINITAGVGLVIYSYFKTPSTSNAQFN